MRHRRSAAPLAVLIGAAILGSPAFAFGPKEFDAKQLRIQSMLGDLKVEVVPGARGITVEVTGSQRLLDRTEVRQDGAAVVVAQNLKGDWSGRDEKSTVTVRLPKGTPVTVADMIGDGVIGDIEAPLDLGISSSAELKVGRVTSAKVRVSGQADIKLAGVSDGLDLAVSGAGDVETGPVKGPARAQISGTGEVRLASLDGALSASISGAGNIAVKGGRIPTLDANISGMGDVAVDATVDSQSVRTSGMGSVRIAGQKVR